MAALFESSTSGGLFFDAAASGAYGDDLDFNYLLSQVGVFDSPASDDSLFSSTLLDDASSTAMAGELSWQVEWFDSSNDIVDLPSYDSTPRSEAHDHVRHSVTSGTNDRTTPQNIKQTVTTPAQKKSKDSKDKDTRDKAAMDYAFFQFNSPSEFYIPDNNFNYPLTPGYTPTYMDPNAYVIDMAKSHSAPSYPIAESTP